MDLQKPKTIRDYRQKNNWTQAQLAGKLGVTPSTVANWESGLSTPNGKDLRMLVATFGIPIHQISLTPYDRCIEIQGHIFYLTADKRAADRWVASISGWDFEKAQAWPQRPADPKYPEIDDTFSAIIGFQDWSWREEARTPEEALNALRDRLLSGVTRALYPERLPDDPDDWQRKPTRERAVRP